jgi:DNA repair exonuclease SbcCD ATPase subunit
MRHKKPVVYKIQKPIMSDADFRQILEGILAHRENLLRFGTPYPPERTDSALVGQRMSELDSQIEECKAKIKELEETKERYEQLLRVIYEEESRIKDEQRARYSGRTETGSEHLHTQP